MSAVICLTLGCLLSTIVIIARGNSVRIALSSTPKYIRAQYMPGTSQLNPQIVSDAMRWSLPGVTVLLSLIRLHGVSSQAPGRKCDACYCL